MVCSDARSGQIFNGRRYKYGKSLYRAHFDSSSKDIVNSSLDTTALRLGDFKPLCDERHLHRIISNAMEDIDQDKQIRKSLQEATMFVIWIESVVSDITGIQE
ncbi:hypothetical protein BC830DRAFT_1147477 [Chytriomyces sp. MP71]|nr:hypothetical protein BC830DRAFT_1147477 [Chytriomyces sp. MP71]